MTSGTEEDLLRMSLTGALSPEAQRSFDAEKDLGNRAFREARYSDAAHHYTSAEQINPLSPVAPANRAMAHLKLSNYTAAKADASVALELYNALPADMQPASLPVKILLRRATANFELLLYALAAEDFASVLELDPQNQPAKAQLKLLKDQFGVVPGTTRAERSQEGGMRGKIELLSERKNEEHPPVPRSFAANGKSSAQAAIQDETPLVELPQNVMNNLVSKWSSVPPQSAFEFERAWKSLQHDPAARAQYLLQTVGPSRLANGLLGESLTPQQLEELVAVMTLAMDKSASNGTAVADVLHALTKVARFDMLLMFLSAEEKRPVTLLLEALRRSGVSAQRISTLKGHYT